MTRIIIKRSLLGWFRWHWRDKRGKTISYSTRRFRSEQRAWEDAVIKFGLPVTMVYTAGGPDETFELYAASREFDSV